MTGRKRRGRYEQAICARQFRLGFAIWLIGYVFGIILVFLVPANYWLPYSLTICLS
jgi:hypothetical protein